MDSLLSSDIALLFARCVLGIVMLYYGIPKIRDLASNANDFVAMGFPPGWLFGTPVALLESIGGAFLILGIIPEFIAAAFAFEMLLGLMWKIKIGKGFPEWSYDMLALAVAVTIMVSGGGLWSGSYQSSWFLRWQSIGVAVVVAICGAIASRPRMKN